MHLYAGDHQLLDNYCNNSNFDVNRPEFFIMLEKLIVD